MTVYNQCVHEGFKKGTFKVDWGDGSAVEEWGTEETMEHVYREFKVFKLNFPGLHRMAVKYSKKTMMYFG